MKHITNHVYLALFIILVSCSSNDEPNYPIFMQPSSIVTDDVNGDNQSFTYDNYGRIGSWSFKSNSTDGTSYTAEFFYPNDKTIIISSEEYINGHKRCFEETIQLTNGRASKSEGTFISYVDGNPELRKTYHMEYEYDPLNHLTVVKHSEVVGIGDDISNNAWNKPLSWENYLIWDDGNLKEFQDYQANNTVTWTTRYEYSIYAVDYPVVIPMVINNAHHLPLFMQGVFGLNSVNLVKSASLYDSAEKISLSRQYTYEFDQARIIEFTETTSYNIGSPISITYKVDWIEKFNQS